MSFASITGEAKDICGRFTGCAAYSSVGLTGVIAAAGLRHAIALPGLILMVVGLAIYTGWILVSVWSCAENIEGRPFGYDPAMWTSLARSLTVAWAINGLALSILLIQMSATNWG